MGNPSIADLLDATSWELADKGTQIYRRASEHRKQTEQAIEGLSSRGAPAGQVLPSLGSGSSVQQSVATFKATSKQSGIPLYSKSKKTDPNRTSVQHGPEPGDQPLESWSRKELIELVKQILQRRV